MKKIILFTLTLLSVLIIPCFADTNGVWHDARDIKPGIMGADEQVGTNLNFTFLNEVFFNNHISVYSSDIDIYSGTIRINGEPVASQTWVSSYLNSNNYATQSWVESKSYATQTWVESKDYATKEFVESALNTTTQPNYCGWRNDYKCEDNEILRGYDGNLDMLYCCGSNFIGCDESDWVTIGSYCSGVCGSNWECGTVPIGTIYNKQKRMKTDCTTEERSINTLATCSVNCGLCICSTCSITATHSSCGVPNCS